MSDIDFTRDYYKILGVSPDASPSEIKSAHREAVLQYHPDIVGKTTQSLDRFRAVQDAYKVISTPELKAELDKIVQAGASKAKSSSGTVVPGTSAASIYDLSHSTVKKNFEENVLQNASSNWSENLPKYKTEKWRKLPLHEKKLTRVRPLWRPHRYFASPYIVIFATTAATVWYCSQPSFRYGRYLSRIESQIQPKAA